MSTNIHYSLKSKEREKINCNQPCYSDITYGTFSEKYEEIYTWQTLAQINYSEDKVKRWITDINEMGFPCSYEGIKEMVIDCYFTKSACYVFKIQLKRYKFKAHLTSALTLIRYLMEDKIREFPKFYFKIMDLYPKLKKFRVMQMCHIYYKEVAYPNTNHTLRGGNATKWITKKELFKRIANTKIPCHQSIYIGNSYHISTIWRGEDILGYVHHVGNHELNLKQYKLIK